jgi:FKBP-type peptidyl-prolyl cis-trans isomerase
MKIKVLLLALGLISTVFVSCQQKSGKAELNTEFDTISYYLGISIGHNLQETPMKQINLEAFTSGMEMVLSGEDTTEDIQEIGMIIGEYMRKLEYAEGQKYLKEGEEFLARNKKRKGVITTESGLQYEILKEGTGPRPAATDEVTVHYHGTLIDGQVFDSSVETGEPVTFPLNRVIPGWTEGVQLMNVGSKYKFYIPTELAYGMRPRQGSIIKPNMALIFEVELLSFTSPPEE